jgi:hypothetical protein
MAKVSKLTPGYWATKIGTELLGWLLVGFIVLAVVLTIYGLKHKASVQHEALREVAGAQVANDVWTDGYKAIAKIKEKEDAKSNEALERNPEWSESVIPDDVADGLRDPNR